jgi:hypothetical protein
MKWLACLALVVPAVRALAQRAVVETATAYRSALRLQLLETARWCRDAEAPGCDFSGISEAVATDEGGLLAANYRGPIRQFDRAGALVREISRKGAGPGEYRFVHSLQIRGQQLAWYDQALRRVTRVDIATGRPGASNAVDLPVAIAGVYLVDGGDMVAFEVPAAVIAGDTVSAAFRIFKTAGTSSVLATVRQASNYRQGSPVPVAQPLFSPGIVADVGWNKDVAHSSASRYEVSVYPSSGAPWRLNVNIPARPVLPADRDSAIAEEVRSNNVRSVAELAPEAQELTRRARTAYPHLESRRVLRDGTLWIRPTPARGATSARWDVFSRVGTRLGYAELPLSATIKDGAERWILAVVLQDDDVPGVVRYDIRR